MKLFQRLVRCVRLSALCLISTSVLAQGSVELQFSDDGTGLPISARMMFQKAAKKVTRPKKLLVLGEQWLAEEGFPLSLANGEYEFLVQRGPEFKEIRGGFTIEPRAKDIVEVVVPRAVDMHAEHWFSGDHLSSLPADVLSRWQAADAVDLVVTTTSLDTDDIAKPTALKKGKPPRSKNREDREQNLDSDSDIDKTHAVGLKLMQHSQRLDWQHGSIVLHPKSIDLKKTQKDAPELPSKTIDVLNRLIAIGDEGKETLQVVELLRPWQRDVPLLLATHSIDAIQILSEANRPSSDDRCTIDQAVESSNKSSSNTGWLTGSIRLSKGKDRMDSRMLAPIPIAEEVRFNDGRGVGRLTEYIYWQMLESGFRITPTAGSDFGINDTRVGYNRVYLHSEAKPTRESWWHQIQQGRTIVTNGPLLRTLVNGLPPGSVQASYRGQPITIDIGVELSVREPVDYLDVIFNGETIYSAKLEEHMQRGEFPPLEVDRSGWLVVRVVTLHDKGYRLATTAPFYFEFDGRPRITKESVAFFQQWLRNAKDQIEPEESKPLLPWFGRSEQFWKDRMDLAH
jgi:hypothetical protein